MNNNPNPQSSSSQRDRMLKYLQSGKKFTTLEALHLFGSMQCPTRIFELKAQGYEIKTTMVKVESGKRVAQYSM